MKSSTLWGGLKMGQCESTWIRAGQYRAGAKRGAASSAAEPASEAIGLQANYERIGSAASSDKTLFSNSAFQWVTIDR
ncbi:hypothetical protein V5738_00435 [Salinisphaera sp. SPP-AMP-43]|uniref:hypothetical protein n=1 Tax=Salinisphaera sp. SPP-AMP-43 TaxID=3121288 RepID=UPI003C6E9777